MGVEFPYRSQYNNVTATVCMCLEHSNHMHETCIFRTFFHGECQCMASSAAFNNCSLHDMSGS